MRKKTTAPHYPRTDTGNAELIADLYGGVLRYDHKRQRWLIWKSKTPYDGRWHEDKQKQIGRFAIGAARKRRNSRAGLADEDKSKKEIGWAFQSEQLPRINAALEIAKSLPQISDPGDGWDDNPWLLGVANGVVDLHSGQLRPAKQQDLVTNSSPVAFEPAADCPRFKLFLDEIFCGDLERIAFLKKVAGYSLTGSTREEIIIIHCGEGQNGKTKLLEIIFYVMGDYAADLPTSVLEKKLQLPVGEGMNLPGARFAKCVEPGQCWKVDEARVKAWTGGDTITVNPKYRPPLTFKPAFKLWVACNHLPVIKDDSEGMWRRIRLLQYTRQFKPEEQDKELPEKLRAEAPGILNWLIEGCLAWQREGLGMPPAVAQATAAYRDESDHIGKFIKDCCVEEPGATVTSGALWQRYQQWTRENEEAPLARQTFAERLEKRGITRDRSGHGGHRTWVGIRLFGTDLEADTMVLQADGMLTR